MQNKDPKISNSVIRRLPIYLRLMQVLKSQEMVTISSQEMGARLDMNPAQIRKDLAYFGEFGRKGVGYEVEYLDRKLQQILHLDRQINVALVGAGHLGIALSNYTRFQSERISIAGLFDADQQKLGIRVGSLIIQDIQELGDSVRSRNIQIGMIAVPATAAQDVCNLLIESGIRIILNFAPINLRVPKNVVLRNTDFTTELQSLAFYIADSSTV